MAREVERDDLDVTPDHMLVLKNGGPKGGPGMPEWGMLPIPKKLVKAGVKRHAAHFRRAHERHQLRRLHPACGAGKFCRRAARFRADRRRDRGRCAGAPHPSACVGRGACPPPRRLEAAGAALPARLWRDVFGSISARPTKAAISIFWRRSVQSQSRKSTKAVVWRPRGTNLKDLNAISFTMPDKSARP